MLSAMAALFIFGDGDGDDEDGGGFFSSIFGPTDEEYRSLNVLEEFNPPMVDSLEEAPTTAPSMVIVSEASEEDTPGLYLRRELEMDYELINGPGDLSSHDHSSASEGGDELNPTSLSTERAHSNSIPFNYVAYERNGTYYADAQNSSLDSYEGTNAATVLQNALDALKNNSVSRSLYLKGLFECDSGLTVPAGTTIKGSMGVTGSNYGSEIRATDASITTLVELESGGGGNASGTVIDGVYINGDDDKASQNLLINCRVSTVMNSAIWRADRFGIVFGSGGELVDVHNNEIAYSGDWAFVLNSDNNQAIKIHHNYVDTNEGILETAQNANFQGIINFHNNRVHYSHVTSIASGLKIDLNDNNANEFSFVVEGNHFSNFHNSVDAIYINGANNQPDGPVKIIGNDFFGYNRDDGTANGRRAINTASAEVQDAIIVKNNHAEGFTDPKPVDLGATLSTLETGSNTGQFNFRNAGSATISSGSTSVSVSHGLSDTPNADEITVIPTSSFGSASKWYIDNIGASSFDINVDADPTQDVTFSWRVRIGRQF